MMRYGKILLSVVITLLPSAVISQQFSVAPLGMSDRENDQLYGPVVSVDETTWRVDYSRRTVVKGEFVMSYLTTYRSDGGVESQINKDNQGMELTKTVHQYEENGDKRVSTTYSSDGQRTLQMLYLYTSDGLCASIRLTDALAVTISTSEVSHGQNWSGVDEVFADGEVRATVYKYNDKGRLTEISVKSNNEQTRTEMRLDSNGHPVKQTVTSTTQKSTYTYEYEVDEHRNWVRRIKYEKGTPVMLTTRIIKYE
ncbi:MAG: hypothetical protein HUJ96_03635 [Marinilabiliaceae bacterium]|nr:hypothetical protein [Marinilabiliaceae bacterium]